MAVRNAHYAFKSLITLTVFLAAACASVQKSPEAAPAISNTLQMDSTRWWHPQLSFSVPNPGAGFETSPLLQGVYDEVLKEADANGRMFIWAFAEPRTREVVLIQVFNNGTLGRDEEGMHEFADGMREARTEDTQSGNELMVGTTMEDTLVWTPETREYRFALHLANGLFTKTRCVASGPTRAKPLVVCVDTVSADSTGLDAFRRGLALDPVPGGQ